MTTWVRVGLATFELFQLHPKMYLENVHCKGFCELLINYEMSYISIGNNGIYGLRESRPGYRKV